MSEEVKIVEVGPRDGLQNEMKILSTEKRVELIRKLIGTGLRFLEGGSFVSPKAIPQMENSDEIWDSLRSESADLCFLVPNQKGFEVALQAGVKSIAVFSATSDAFTRKNINRSVEESLDQFEPIVGEAKRKKIRVRGYISTVFGCPYEGFQDPKKCLKVTERLFKMGADEISIGDTIGVAHPRQIASVFGLLKKGFDIRKIAAHLHDTRGMAIVNIREALGQGVRVFDASIGGLGGCPYATGSSGNVATEEVCWLLEGLGFKTGVSVARLLAVAAWVEKEVERALKAKFYLSGPKHLYYDEPQSME
ncbi:MAG: hydroxymethylglutaryl-CoA lyase [Deltaproteobacteria bacterium CG11_big_fil_rev_8_21_14_0_20_45_16]|nr:MAG: hydroxymethylglutaryl-CoA lyase [Deltaproteobacteria bacterium CG11_big_fil_rev_8_21_14_0_20_45_16]